MMRHNSRGFTLIEILVALMIFAIMGVLAAMSLQSMLRTHNRLKKVDASLTQLQMTMTLMRRDIIQVIDRPIINADGIPEAAFIGNGGNQIVFTRTGLQNHMQRVGYTVDGHKLIRLTWDVLDQPPRAEPEKQIVLNHVQSLQWQFLNDKNQLVSSWPPAKGSNLKMDNQSSLPKAVEMVMHIENAGVIQGVFPVPARGIAHVAS